MGRWRLASRILKGLSVNSTNKLPSRLFISNPAVSVVLTHLPNPNFTFCFNSRPFSAIPSHAAATYINELDPIYPEFDPDSVLSGIEEDEESGTGTIPIKAYFLSTSIDLKSLQAENLSNVLPPNSRSSNYVALRYCDFLPSDTTGFRANKRASCCRYMIVCQYGSAVLFNVEDREIEDYLSIVRRHASGLLREMRKDDYAVKEKPMLLGDMQGGPDYVVLKALDTDGIRIIGSVLGQSIALDYFVSQVDGMVEEFADINRIMEKTGTFTMDRRKLLQLVGKANSNLADVILKVGLFERSEIAWREAKYAQIYEYLREEFEVTQRFGNLNFKLKFVEHNIHFLQEVIQNKRSNLLEWCIIFLLSIENIISLYEIIRETNQVS